MVEEIKELSPELQIRGLTEGQRKVFDDREIRVDKNGAIHWSARGCSKLSGRGLGESAGVEPVL